MFGKILRLFSLSIFLVCLIFTSTSSFALTKGFEAISLRPATDGGPYIGIWGSENLGKFDWELGTFARYSYRPFQLTRGGKRTRGVIDNDIVQHFYAQLGIVDHWLSLGFELPVGWWVDFKDPNIATATNQNKFALGDIYINLKSEFVRTRYFGLALRPFISIPTGYGREFFGNGGVTGGGTLIGEIKPTSIWSISINAGVQGREEFNFRNIEKSNQLELGLGTAIQVSKPVSIVAEIASSTRLSGPFSEEVESPTEARGAIKWKIGKSGFLATAGGTAGIVRGSGAPTYSVFAGLSFSPRRREKRARLDLNRYTVHFPTNGYSINDSNNASKICKLADLIRDKKVNIAVTGYTDSTGNEQYNKKLSKKRAEKVAWWLNLLGIDSSRIMATGKGSENPISDNSTKEGRSLNRRVEFSK